MIITNIYITADFFWLNLINYIIKKSDCSIYWGARLPHFSWGGARFLAATTLPTGMLYEIFQVKIRSNSNVDESAFVQCLIPHSFVSELLDVGSGNPLA